MSATECVHPNVLFGSDTASLGFELEEQDTAELTVHEDQVREAGHVAAAVVVVKHEPAVHLGGVGQQLLQFSLSHDVQTRAATAARQLARRAQRP